MISHLGKHGVHCRDEKALRDTDDHTRGGEGSCVTCFGGCQKGGKGPRHKAHKQRSSAAKLLGCHATRYLPAHGRKDAAEERGGLPSSS